MWATEGMTVLKAVMSLALLVTAAGRGMDGVAITAVYVAIIWSAVRVARSDGRALKVSGRKVIKGLVEAFVFVGGFVQMLPYPLLFWLGGGLGRVVARTEDWFWSCLSGIVPVVLCAP